DELDADGAAAAGAGFDEELLLVGRRELFGGNPGEHVGGAAGRESADHPHRPGRPFVGGGRGGRKRRKHQGEGGVRASHGGSIAISGADSRRPTAVPATDAKPQTSHGQRRVYRGM